MRWIKKHALKIAVHHGALLPLVVLIQEYLLGHLTANPIREIQLRTGLLAITLLILSLAVTPVYIMTGFKQLLPLRRMLGLYAFGWGCLHFLNFIWLDYGFDLALIREDIFDKRYAVVGFAAFILLLPLAVTSTEGWIRRLSRNWQRLHWLVYPAALLALVHFVWQTKADFALPVIYGVVLVLLFLFRIPRVRRVIGRKW